MEAALALLVGGLELGKRHFLRRVVRHFEVVGTGHHRRQVVVCLEWCLKWLADHCKRRVKVLEAYYNIFVGK